MKKLFLFLFLFIAFIVYSFFVYTSGTEKVNVFMNAGAISGKLLYQEHNCTACHQIYGLGGYLGPELTTVISDKGKGEEYARAFLKGGTQRMPDFQLTESEIECLVEFLKYVDLTATTYKE